ncbi:LamG-like jellyroll fold domain-containing protein (plasmid) [Pseudoalteromonas sp. T1lg65]|uniref:LamG-like jellyroll fold domain-containing protein n=1 Tax=Pseudoalteromonas sp. T1lg65 TaxID=2077101 RepID=UPI003F79354F
MDKFAPENKTDELKEIRGFWLGQIYADVKTEKISNGSAEQQLSSLSFKLLRVLAARNSEPLSPEQLQHEVWSGIITGNENVKQRISILRRSLQQLDTQEHVKTVRGRGYQLISPVRYDVNTQQSQQKSLFLGAIILICCVFAGLLYTVFNTKLQSVTSSSSQVLVQQEQAIKLAKSQENLAFCLDGYDDFVEVNEPNLNVSQGDFSIMTWIKSSGLGQHVIVDKRFENQISNVQGYALYIDDGYLSLQLADGNGDWYCQNANSSCTFYNSSAFVADNLWHHVAVSVDRDNQAGANFYVDGVHVSTLDPTDRRGSLSNSMPFRIGSRSSYKTGLFKGAIGEVVFYHNAIDEYEVRAHYAKENLRTCSENATKGGL